MVPSTWPSMVRSSLPISSTLMTTHFPIFTMSFSIGCLASCLGIGTPTVVGAVDEVVVCGPPGRPASSRFHMVSPRPSWHFFQGALARIRLHRRDVGVAGQYMRQARSCLVLFLPGLSGSGTMNDSL